MCKYIILEDFKIDKYIYDESNGLWYELQGEYYLCALHYHPKKISLSGYAGNAVILSTTCIADIFELTNSYNDHKQGFYVYAKPNLCDPKTAFKYIGRYLGDRSSPLPESIIMTAIWLLFTTTVMKMNNMWKKQFLL